MPDVTNSSQVAAVMGGKFKCCICNVTHYSLKAGGDCYKKLFSAYAGRGYRDVRAESLDVSSFLQEAFPGRFTQTRIDWHDFSHALALPTQAEAVAFMKSAALERAIATRQQLTDLLNENPELQIRVYKETKEYDKVIQVNGAKFSFKNKDLMLWMTKSDHLAGALDAIDGWNWNFRGVRWKRLNDRAQFLVRYGGSRQDSKGDKTGLASYIYVNGETGVMLHFASPNPAMTLTQAEAYLGTASVTKLVPTLEASPVSLIKLDNSFHYSR